MSESKEEEGATAWWQICNLQPAIVAGLLLAVTLGGGWIGAA